MDTNTQQLKQLAAKKALAYVNNNTVLGIGSGSTVMAFIEELGNAKIPLKGVVAASKQSEERLRAFGYEILDLNLVDELDYYIDGADEVTKSGAMIKGGGAALTREKIIATVAKKFICIVDESKVKALLGQFPLPVEVIPLARSYVARKLLAMGGNPKYRIGVITDNGNVILDVNGLKLTDYGKFESDINQITGVVENGIFSSRIANIIIVANRDGKIEEIKT